MSSWSYGDVFIPQHSLKDVVGVAWLTGTCIVLVSRVVETFDSLQHAKRLGDEARPRVWVDSARKEDGSHLAKEGWQRAARRPPPGVSLRGNGCIMYCWTKTSAKVHNSQFS